jgi:valyl-tRNA synthetase
MRGKEVFHPIGWDDHDPAAEHRVRAHFGVCHDPAATDRGHRLSSLPHDPYTGSDGTLVPVSRHAFAELHGPLAAGHRQAHLRVWRRMGLSVDLTRAYRTGDAAARAVAQLAFLRNLARGEAYQAEAPTLWATGSFQRKINVKG